MPFGPERLGREVAAQAVVAGRVFKGQFALSQVWNGFEAMFQNLGAFACGEVRPACAVKQLDLGFGPVRGVATAVYAFDFMRFQFRDVITRADLAFVRSKDQRGVGGEVAECG